MDSNLSLNINVPPDQQEAVAGFQDGGTYHITIQQVGPSQFNLVSVDGQDEETEESPMNKEMNPGSTSDTTGTTIPSKNPAVAALIISKKAGYQNKPRMS